MSHHPPCLKCYYVADPARALICTCAASRTNEWTSASLFVFFGQGHWYITMRRNRKKITRRIHSTMSGTSKPSHGEYVCIQEYCTFLFLRACTLRPQVGLCRCHLCNHAFVEVACGHKFDQPPLGWLTICGTRNCQHLRRGFL